MTKDEALRMAIETLEYLIRKGEPELVRTLLNCKEALAQPAQEPVAWMDRTYGNLHKVNYGDSIPLYTHPCVLTHTAPTIELKPANIAKARDEIYYAWRKYWAWGIPSKDGEAVFNANGDGFLAGWLACEEALKEKNNAMQ